MRAYIIEGPATIGNVFGFHGHRIASGAFAIVTDDEYANGGYGPCSVDGKRYHSRAAAEKCVRKGKVSGVTELSR